MEADTRSHHQPKCEENAEIRNVAASAKQLTTVPLLQDMRRGHSFGSGLVSPLTMFADIDHNGVMYAPTRTMKDDQELCHSSNLGVAVAEDKINTGSRSIPAHLAAERTLSHRRLNWENGGITDAAPSELTSVPVPSEQWISIG